MTSTCLFFLSLEFLSRANGCLVPANKWQYSPVTTFAGTVSYLYAQGFGTGGGRLRGRKGEFSGLEIADRRKTSVVS